MFVYCVTVVSVTVCVLNCLFYYKNTPYDDDRTCRMVYFGLYFFVSCIVHILKHLTSQNEVKDGKINTCETSMSLVLPFYTIQTT